MWGCARRCCPNASTMVYKCAWHSAGARGGPLPTQRIVPVLQTPAPRPAQEGTASVPRMLTPSRHCDSRAFHARQSRRILESGSLAPPPAALRRFPTFSFVLAKDKVNCPKGKRGAPGGKRAAPGTKENRLFIGLLVRPVETGLVSSSCAKRWAFPGRSRRNCCIGCRIEGAKRTRGPPCAAAARPGIRSKFLPRRCIYVLLLPTERQRRCCGQQSYLHQRFSISGTNAA